jgi:predicted nucleic acid-binding protein
MLFVIDTNILLVSLKRGTQYSIIFDQLIDERFDLAISNEIIYEYFEVNDRKINDVVAEKVINLLIALPNVHIHEPFFK